jgi:hypothetical protein
VFRLPHGLLACAGVCLVTGIYACDAGHGFVKDDFAWILTSREWSGFSPAATGFFRPAVSLTFSLDYALFGQGPLGYGLTNLGLLLACTAVIAALFRALRLGMGVAVGAALVWALNLHGINMAVLWISGRTALMLTLCSVAAAWAWTRGWRLWSAACLALAVLSKEEAFVLPAILTVWSIIDVQADRSRDRLRVIVDTWPLWAVWVAGLVLRVWSGAFTPSTAPPIYRYRYDLGTLAANALEYTDRSVTTALVALLVFWLAAGRPRVSAPGDTRQLALKGGVWLLFAFAPTILLPVRSSLYAVMPSIGAVLILAALAAGMVPRLSPPATLRAAVLLLLTFVLLLPVYRSRNQRFVREAELSTAITTELQRIAASVPAGGLVVIRDVRPGRPTAEQALGGLADRAALLTTDGRIRVWIDPAPMDLAGVPPPDLSSAIATIHVEGGVIGRGLRPGGDASAPRPAIEYSR